MSRGRATTLGKQHDSRAALRGQRRGLGIAAVHHDDEIAARRVEAGEAGQAASQRVVRANDRHDDRQRGRRGGGNTDASRR
jgi:hypothetical protein